MTERVLFQLQAADIGFLNSSRRDTQWRSSPTLPPKCLQGSL